MISILSALDSTSARSSQQQQTSGTDRAERPTGAALALVLDLGDGAVLSPVHVLGRRHARRLQERRRAVPRPGQLHVMSAHNRRMFSVISRPINGLGFLLHDAV